MGLLVAILVDRVLDVVLKWGGYDPEQKIADQVESLIRRIDDGLIAQERRANGQKKGALRARLEKIHDARATIRRETVAQRLNGGNK